MTHARRPLRADARRNHESLLDAACDLFVERGPDVALEEIARRAGVGIATLYRRFPDRPALMQAVVANALRATCDAAQRALDEADDPLAALANYMHAAIDLKAPAVIPTLLDHVDLDTPELTETRQRSAELAERLIDGARDCGAIRKDTTFGDVGLMLVRIARALPGPIDAQTQRQLAHRHVDLVLNGLRTESQHEPLTGPALELEDLRSMRTAT